MFDVTVEPFIVVHPFEAVAAESKGFVAATRVAKDGAVLDVVRVTGGVRPLRVARVGWCETL